MINFLKNEKGSYLIKNIIKKRFERDFSINPLNIFIFILFSAVGYILYFYYGNKITDINDFSIFMILPIIGTIGIFFGKWESLIKILFISILGYYWWKGFNSLYFSVPICIGLIISPMFQIVKEWERAVRLRLGKFNKLKGPGLFLILPLFDSINKIVELRIRATDFAAETTPTRDSVPVTVDAIAFWMVWDAEKAVLEVENYVDAVILSAQTALRDAIGEKNLSAFLAEREELGKEVRAVVDKKTSEWGITIQTIEIRDIIIPKQLEDALMQPVRTLTGTWSKQVWK